jgi:two-component sensor histidine kinase
VYRSPDAEIGLQIDVRDVFLSVDAAIPCGLIINELVSNSLKYAFRTTRRGSVWVRMTHAGGEYELRVGDDGEGLPVTLNVEQTESLGLQLVHTLVKQLRAVMRVSREGGTVFTVVIPETEGRDHG